MSKLLKVSLKKLALVITPALILSAPPALSSAEDITHRISISLPDLQRQKELVYMVQQDCGSCHGMTLKGGLGPSLLPERVSVLPKDYLIKAVTHGRPGTPMPPWAPILTAGEIQWIVEQLQLGQLGQTQ